MEPDEEIGASSAAPNRMVWIGGIVAAILVVGGGIGWLGGKVMAPAAPQPVSRAANAAAPIFQPSPGGADGNNAQSLLLTPGALPPPTQPALPDTLAADAPPAANTTPPPQPSVAAAPPPPTPAPKPAAPPPAIAPKPAVPAPAPPPLVAAAPPPLPAPAPAPRAHHRSRHKAAATLASRHRAGRVPPVIVLDASRAKPGMRWMVQLGAFHSPAYAQDMMAELKAEGEAAELTHHGAWYVVHTPIAASLGTAKAVATGLAERHGLQTYVVPVTE